MLSRFLRQISGVLWASLAETYVLGCILVRARLSALFLTPYAALVLQLILPSLVGMAWEAPAAIVYMDNAGGGAEGAGLPGQGPPQGGGAAGGGGAGPGGPAAPPLVDLTGDDGTEPANCQTFPRDNLECFTVPATGEVWHEAAPETCAHDPSNLDRDPVPQPTPPLVGAADAAQGQAADRAEADDHAPLLGEPSSRRINYSGEGVYPQTFDDWELEFRDGLAAGLWGTQR